MTFKSIEIYYDISAIPHISDRTSFSIEALDFRNDAMEHIEAALEAAELGKWVGAEIGSGEVNFGFEVPEFDAAEAVVRKSVEGTRFAAIREIRRREFDEDDELVG